jgi:hypothetical protein
MPVPWPVPTAVQQQLTSNSQAPPAAQSIGKLSDPMPAQEISSVKATFDSLLQHSSQDGNVRKWEDTARKLTELYDKLATGQLSGESMQKVKDMCRSISQGDFAGANRLRVELSASDWERNRTWLFAVQLLLPK